MPIHDWSRVPAGLFHDFHQGWTVEIAAALNRGRLPAGHAALLEPSFPSSERDPTARKKRSVKEHYARRGNRIAVKRGLARDVAVIDILSPGNKDSRAALRDFVEKTIDFLRAGVHVLIVDLFPPTPRDPLGIHKAIWDEIVEEDFAFPPDKDRILVSYETGGERAAYLEPVGVGDPLPDMPLFLTNDLHVNVPLESTGWS
jgi:hypothetical protein